MKKTYLFSCLAAAALMTACSSDAPEAPGTNSAEDMMYVSLKLSMPQTRAEQLGTDAGTHVASTAETTINSVTLFIYKQDGENLVPVISANVGSSDITGKDLDKNNNATTATFQIPKSTFKELSDLDDDDTSVKFYVVCNAASTVVDPYSDLNFEATTKVAPWGNKAAGDFIMAGYMEAPLDPRGTNDGTDKGTPWNINANIKVDRLAARFDYTLLAEYPAIAEDAEQTGNAQGIIFTTIGAREVNLNDSEYIFLHKASAFGGTSVLVTEATKSTYNYFVSTKPATYEFAGVALGGTTETTLPYVKGTADATTGKLMRTEYVRPLTLQKLTEETKNEVTSFKQVTYVAFKTKMTTAEGAPKIVADAFASKKPIYAYKGVLLGTAADLEKYNESHAGIDFSNSVIREFWRVANSNVTAENDIDKCLRAFYEDGLYQYNYETDGYYCYYFRAISDSETGTDAQKYAIVRNHLYDIQVLNISKVGWPGDYTPDDIDPNVKDYYFDITINALPWEQRNNHFEF